MKESTIEVDLELRLSWRLPACRWSPNWCNRRGVVEWKLKQSLPCLLQQLIQLQSIFPSLRLFCRFHTTQVTIANNTGPLFSAKMPPNKSMKDVVCFKLSWFQTGTLFQSSYSFGHEHKACFTSSWWFWQGSQRSSMIICRLTKFVFIGKEFLVALHARFFTLLEQGSSRLPATMVSVVYYRIGLADCSGIPATGIGSPTWLCTHQ